MEIGAAVDVEESPALPAVRRKRRIADLERVGDGTFVALHEVNRGDGSLHPYAFPLTCDSVSRGAGPSAFSAVRAPVPGPTRPGVGQCVHDRCDRRYSALHSGRLSNRGPRAECAQRFPIRQGLPGWCALGWAGMTEIRTFGSME